MEMPSLSGGIIIEERFLRRQSAMINARSTWLHAMCGLGQDR